MSRLAIWAQLEAKQGKEKEVEDFLKSAQPLAEREPGTVSWYAIKLGPGKSVIFDPFPEKTARTPHPNGKIPRPLSEKAKPFFPNPPNPPNPAVPATKSASSNPTARPQGFFGTGLPPC